MRTVKVCLLGLSLSACASHRSLGVQYQASGKHDIAVHYMAAANAKEGRTKESQQALVDSINNSLANLAKEYDDARDSGNAIRALSVAVRQQELLIWASGNQIPGFDPNTVNEQVKEAREAAIKEAQETLDRYAGEQNTEKEMQAVRQALGLDPNNPDFVSRYQRLKSMKERRILLRSNCSARFQVHCDAALSQIASVLTDAKREAIVISTPASRKEDALLTLSISGNANDTSWGMLRSGRETSEVQVYNAFKEPKVDKKGRKITKTVTANWRLYGAKSSAALHIKVNIKSLRSDKSMLFSASEKDQRSERRSYYDWNGDHRALGYAITKHGQNQTLPPNSREISEAIRVALTSKIANNIINQLEY